MRKAIIAIFCCIVLLLLGYAGYQGYQVWKQSHLVAMARGFAQAGDVRNEQICLQLALKTNPRNPEACRLMANVAESLHSPEALVWRHRAFELNPKSLDDRLALVQTALVFKDYATATNTLAGVDAAGQQMPAYHNLAGVVALELGDAAGAKAHFSAAAQLEPANLAPRLNLALVRLRDTNAAELLAAREDLKQISLTATNLSIRRQATREMIVDALRAKDTAAAAGLAAGFAQATNADFADRLLRLDVLKAAGSDEFKPALAGCQRDAAADPIKLAQLTPWLMVNTTPARTLAWLSGLPLPVRTNQPAVLQIAECQMLTQDWPGLQAGLGKQDWAELEFMRHAFLARALRGQNMAGTSAAEWEVALRQARDQKGALIELFQLAAAWQWTDEAEEILWVVVNRYPEEAWAVPVLRRALIIGGRTRPLMQLFNVQAKRSPDDIEIKNNLAMTAMLLGDTVSNPYELARTVYERAPENPDYAATYAFALYLQKKYFDARKIMEKISPKDLNNPSASGYYGLLLQATGDSARAKVYLKWALKGQLMPEEKKMFEQALAE